jgi:RND family efflux transporter MFP subunit
MNRWFVIALIAVVSVGCVDRKSQQQAKETERIVSDPVRPVTVQPVSFQTLVDSIEITGDLVTSLDTQVAAKVGGRLISVNVKDGDVVSQGQILAALDNTQQLAQLQQAMSAQQQASAGLQSAQSQLAQAVSNAALSPARTSAAVRQAEAQLRSVRAQLLKAQNGARPEERKQAEAALASAKTNLENQRKELNRITKLAAEGAVAANRVDQLQTAVAAAEAQYEQANQALAILQTGTRSEDIAAARAAVQQAEEGVRSARAQKSLDVVLGDQVNSARAQVDSARANVQSAGAQIRIAQQNLSDTLVRAPFSGRVQGKPSQVGTVVAPGTPILQLVGGEGVYFSGQVPETQISKIQVGKSVDVTITALPNQHFVGRIAAVSPQGSNVGRLFDVRVQIAGNMAGVKPGMFAKGQVQLQVVPSATVIPKTAVVTQGTLKYVFIVEGEKAKRIPVQTGLEQGNVVQVTGVPTSAKVIVRGQTGLSEGAPIRVETAQAALADARGARG